MQAVRDSWSLFETVLCSELQASTNNDSRCSSTHLASPNSLSAAAATKRRCSCAACERINVYDGEAELGFCKARKSREKGVIPFVPSARLPACFWSHAPVALGAPELEPQLPPHRPLARPEHQARKSMQCFLLTARLAQKAQQQHPWTSGPLPEDSSQYRTKTSWW